ncbi:MAG: hypothetical protein HZA93_07225 [Verrucomicrobia bacterium]|nr:hypothetical protein [Verrucomicrobiota bacterium]
MKKATSLPLAVISALFLAIGAIRAAETFDGLAHGSVAPASNHDERLPGPYCGMSEPQKVAE